LTNSSKDVIIISDNEAGEQKPSSPHAFGYGVNTVTSALG